MDHRVARDYSHGWNGLDKGLEAAAVNGSRVRKVYMRLLRCGGNF
jgi:hypothetical protein